VQVDESPAVEVFGDEEAIRRGGPDAALVVAKRLLAEGELAKAADTLAQSTRGTAAAAVVAGWCEQARQRAVADQALRMLRAHATTLAASVAQ
jgi:mitofilin